MLIDFGSWIEVSSWMKEGEMEGDWISYIYLFEQGSDSTARRCSVRSGVDVLEYPRSMDVIWTGITG